MQDWRNELRWAMLVRDEQGGMLVRLQVRRIAKDPIHVAN